MAASGGDMWCAGRHARLRRPAAAAGRKPVAAGPQGSWPEHNGPDGTLWGVP
jgi:hypothetical protein